jgi:hypothetical protein
MYNLPSFNQLAFTRGYFVEPNPPANTGIDLSFPTTAIIQYLSIRVSLGTDANVADRYLRLTWSILSGQPCFLVVPFPTPASSLRAFCLALGFPVLESPTVLHDTFFPLPDKMFLYPPDQLHLTVDNMQAGDTLVGCSSYFTQWTIPG